MGVSGTDLILGVWGEQRSQLEREIERERKSSWREREAAGKSECVCERVGLIEYLVWGEQRSQLEARVREAEEEVAPEP